MEKEIVKKLLKLNIKAKKNQDVPVSCIIVKDNKIIVEEYNRKYINNDPFAHAEILAIRKASKKLNTPNLNDCVMYVSLCPCNMCKEVIKEARIKEVYYILDNIKIVNNNTSYKKIKTESESLFKEELINFFNDKR